MYMYLHVCIDLYIHVRCCIYSRYLHLFPIIYSATKNTLIIAHSLFI